MAISFQSNMETAVMCESEEQRPRAQISSIGVSVAYRHMATSCTSSCPRVYEMKTFLAVCLNSVERRVDVTVIMISAWHRSSSIGCQLNFGLVMCINEMLMLRLCHNKAAPSVPSVEPIRAETQQLQHPSNGSGQSQENCCLSVVLADRHASF